MITLELSRFYGAPGYTWGTMKESLTGFSCWTMERHDPNHWRGMKNYCAIPAGQYRLRVTTRDNLKLNLRLLIPGTYRKAELTNACVPNDQPAGSICVGKKEQEVIKDFVRWFCSVDLRNSLLQFGERYNELQNKVVARKIPQSKVYDKIGEVFEASDVRQALQRAGKRTPVKVVISLWKTNGLIESLDKNKYKKLKKL